MSKKVKHSSEDYMSVAEERFKGFSDIDEDISIYPLHSNTNTNIATNKSKSKEFGEVFTPLWLVDGMIAQTKVKSSDTTLDLCAGYGQFSIRLLRRLLHKNKDFDYSEFLTKNHSFAELQLDSCYKLLYIFGKNINLFIGDATKLPSLPGVATGIWCYIEAMDGWVPITKTVKSIFCPEGWEKDDHPGKTFVKKLEKIISAINRGYKKMAAANVNVRYSPDTRLHVLKLLDGALNELHPKDKSVRTPSSVVNDILSAVDDIDKKQILVLFTGEIIETLVHVKKIAREQITFGVDEANAARATFISKMYPRVNTCVFADKDPKSILAALGSKKWDLVLSNPPYNRGLDLKILQAMLDANVATEYVVVHPSTWLLDQKDKKPQYLTFKKTLEKKLKSVKLFNGNGVFGIELFVPCTITHIDTNYGSSTISVELFGDKFMAESIKDITKFGPNWKIIVEPFFQKMETLTTHNNVWLHNETSVDPNKVYCQLAAIRGDVRDRGKTKVSNLFSREITTDNFYTMLISIENNKGIREPRLDKPGGHTPTFGFKTEVERDNFLSYLNTDFARFCLALYKIGQHLENGELEIIPWLDFTQVWDDDKLFSHFEIDQKTQDYIRSFLPDYYSIRKPATPASDMASFKMTWRGCW